MAEENGIPVQESLVPWAQTFTLKNPTNKYRLQAGVAEPKPQGAA
jgi:hypothetical protein